MRVACEISVSPRALLGTSSALCRPHMSLRNVRTDRRADSHACEQTDRWETTNNGVERRPERGKR